jgi:tocopherol O-methyltransferase
VAELVYAHDSKSCSERSVGSIPTSPTISIVNKTRQIHSVNNYYDRTRREYNLFWGSRRNLAMHFGFFEKGISSHDDAVANLNQHLAELIGLKKDDTVLDAGCGLGGSTLWLADTRGCNVTGVNVVKWQNDIARSEAVKRKLAENVKFIEADYAQTGLPAGSFTVFWGVEAIVHAIDKQAVIKEASRLLKPGGRILISEYILKDEPLSARDQSLVNSWLHGWAMPNLLSEKQYRELLSKAGFTDIRVFDWTEHVRPSLDRLRHFVWLVRPFKKILRILDFINDDQIGDYEASKAQMGALDKGIWRYKIITCRKPLT